MRKSPARGFVFTRTRLACAAAATLAMGAPAAALETKVSGRIAYGSVYRADARDPRLLFTFNAAAIGTTGLANAGQNSDDGNLNYDKGDAISRALRAYVDLEATEGALSGLLRLKAWHDFGLCDDARPWGNSVNGYAGGQPLSDAGAARLSKFSGAAVGDAYLQYRHKAEGVTVLTRLGQQVLDWGQRAGAPGGLAAINANDNPALHRAGALPQELKVAAPMLFARAELAGGLSVDGFYAGRFRPTALDQCGTFWQNLDYTADGCNRAFAGAPNGSDRMRYQAGAYIKRIDSPTSIKADQYGAALNWKGALPSTDLGLFYAHYTNRFAVPGLRKSSRVGPAIIAGDPDGKNVAFFLEYVPDIEMFGLTATHKRDSLTLYGELTYRPNQVLQQPASDVLGAFLNATAPALLRADATATAPGGIFHAYDQYATLQSQFSAQREWKTAGGSVFTLGGEVVHKHVASLPDPLLRRYLRSDQFGSGPVFGVCNVTTTDAARQCSSDGYASPDAWSYRMRFDARFAQVLPALNLQAAAVFIHDVRGWSYDGLINEGRKMANLALRAEFRKRYLAELVYAPVWNGVYNQVHDRDTYAFSVGVKF